MCEKIFSKRAKFFCSHAAGFLKPFFLLFFWFRGLIMILFDA